MPAPGQAPDQTSFQHRADVPASRYVVAGALSCALLVLPFCLVTFPPITDLPQQMAQVRLAGEAFSGDGPYHLNLLAPGVLGYALFAVADLVAPPLAAGRLAYALLGVAWIVSLTVLLAARGRSPVLAPLAALFFFSHSLYWGFASFLLGAALFFLWLVLEERLRARPGGGGEAAVLATAALALYSAHAFWCLAALLWLLAASLAARLTLRRLGLRLTSCVVPAILALGFSPQISASGFASQTTWWTSPLARLAPAELVNRIFGGLQGSVEPVILVAVAAWIVGGTVAHRAALRKRSDLGLLLLACGLVAASLLLPDRFQNTLGFAGRWAPVGVAMLAAALPLPKIRPSLRWSVPLVLLATLAITTTAAWQRFERTELTGLDASLAALPESPAVLGLDFYRLSTVVKTQPFFQIAAWAQVLHGGTLGFSFASFPTSPVVFSRWENPPWTPGLEWLPHQIFESIDDVRYFDYLLVHADPPGHEYFAQQELLEAVTRIGRWRLFRVLE